MSIRRILNWRINGKLYRLGAVKTSELENDSGYQTAQDVQTAIAGVRQLPTGGTTGDFLRRDAQGNAAWETLSTWQGGSY